MRREERKARRERKDQAWKESLGGRQGARETIRREAWDKGFKAGYKAIGAKDLRRLQQSLYQLPSTCR